MMGLEQAIEDRTAPGTSLRGLWSALRRQRKVAALTFVVLASIAALGVKLLPRQYDAEMKLLVSNDRPSEVVTPGVSSSPVRADVDENQINSEIELMTNRGVLKRVAEEVTPALAASHRAGNVAGQSAADSAVDAARRTHALEKQVRDLEKHLHVEAARKSDIVAVTYTDRDPDHAERVLTRLLVDYLDTHTRAHAAPGTYSFFRQQADSFGGRLTAVDAQLEQLEAQDGGLGLPEEEDELVRGRESAQASLLASTASVAAQGKSLAQGSLSASTAPSSLETESRSTPNQYAIERMRTLLVELRNKRADLLTNFPPTDRQVGDLDRQIAITTDSLAAAVRDENVERVTGINPVRQSLETEINHTAMSLAAERARHTVLAQQIGAYDHRLSLLAAAKLQHAALVRQQKEFEDNYLLYNSKAEEARAAEALDAQRFSNISVVEAPMAFHDPSQPKVALDLLLAWALAFCLAIVAALSFDRYWGDVVDADTLGEITGLPVLGLRRTEVSW